MKREILIIGGPKIKGGSESTIRSLKLVHKIGTGQLPNPAARDGGLYRW